MNDDDELRRVTENAAVHADAGTASPAAGEYRPGESVRDYVRPVAEGVYEKVSPDASASAQASHHRPAPPPGENPAAVAFKTIPLYLKELASWTAHLIGAKVDGIKITLRNVAIYAALGVVGLIAAVAIICKAVGLLLSGLSDAIAAIFLWAGLPHMTWVGPLVVGLLVLGGLALGIKIGLSKVMGASRKQLDLKYEGKRIRERMDFGRDVSERAAASKKRQKQERKEASV